MESEQKTEETRAPGLDDWDLFFSEIKRDSAVDIDKLLSADAKIALNDSKLEKNISKARLKAHHVLCDSVPSDVAFPAPTIQPAYTRSQIQ
jgi:hypothetical protein